MWRNDREFKAEVLTRLFRIEVLIRDLSKEVRKDMSLLSDKIGVVNTAVDDARNRVVTDVAALNKQIADLQALVDAGSATQADLDALDALKVKVDAIDPTTPTTIPVP